MSKRRASWLVVTIALSFALGWVAHAANAPK